MINRKCPGLTALGKFDTIKTTKKSTALRAEEGVNDGYKGIHQR